jgi:prepilin-type N-terminal cleavage/methylation domain-containing protein/prepilin-type processing-associated H-X9-DG protein
MKEKASFATRNTPQSCKGPQDGFTASELIAVIAIVSLLASVMVTTMAGTRGGVAAVQCRNNLRQLVGGWSMYTDDNRGKLVYNHDGTQAGLSFDQAAWVAGWCDFTSSPQNTNTDMLVNHIGYPFGAYLGPYVKGDATLFKCPADRSEVVIAGKRVPRVRSVSLNNFLGSNSRTWSGQGVIVTNLTQIKSPIDMFIILDERADSINDGLFWSDPDTSWQMVDFPGAYHNGSGSLSFADGHAETHRWNDTRTNPILQAGQLLPLNKSLPGDLDVFWLQQHAVGKSTLP